METQSNMPEACALYADLYLTERIKMYYVLVLIVIGLVGNTLSILVFSSKDLRVLASSTYLLMLAVSDSVVLVTSVGAQKENYLWILCLSGSDLSQTTEVLYLYLHNVWSFAGAFSSFVILAFTVERYAAVCKPLYYRQLSAHPRPYYICLTIGALLVVLILPDFVTLNTVSTTGFFTSIGKIIFFFAPCICITVLNSMIAHRLWHQDGVRRRCLRNNRETFNTNRHITIVLLLIVISYHVTYIPYNVISFIALVDFDLLYAEWSRPALAVTTILYITGFAGNFALYTLSTTTFRRRLISILCSRNRTNELH